MLGAGAFRGAAINSFLFKHAVSKGMREGETAACLANLQVCRRHTYLSMTAGGGGGGGSFMLCCHITIRFLGT